MKLLTLLILSTILLLLLFQEAKPQPIIEVEPEFIEADWQNLEYVITIHNRGDQNLRWWSEIVILNEPDDGRNGEIDEGGYFYRFSLTPGGPRFEWFDYQDDDGAMQLEATDDWISDEIELGLEVPWYGETYSSIRVCSNGWITFDTDYNGVDANLPEPPDDSAPNNILLVNQIDLNPEAGGEIWFHTVDDEPSIVVVSWVGVAHADNEEVSSTFQILIHDSGLITYQYGEMIGHEGEDVTIGYENQDGSLGAYIEIEADHYLSELMAVGIGTFGMFTNWIALEPVEGEVQPGGEEELILQLEPTGLIGGEYDAELVISSNDEDNNPVIVNVVMNVEGAPDIDVDIEQIDFNENEGFILVGETYEVPVRISNAGTADLQINEISSNHEYYSTDWNEEDQAVLGIFEFLDINFIFQPEEAGLYEGVITINSNDFDEENFEIPVRGIALQEGVPAIEVSPDQIDFSAGADSIYVGELYEIPITISSIGLADLEINDIRSNHEFFSTNWDREQNILAPDEIMVINILFNPEEGGLHEGMITIDSNSPQYPEYEIVVSGNAFELSIPDAEARSGLPDHIYLANAYPNPFNSTSHIEFGLPVSSVTILKIIDITGKTVSTLSNGFLPAGHHRVSWEADGNPAGIYLCQLSSSKAVKTIKLLLVN